MRAARVPLLALILVMAAAGCGGDSPTAAAEPAWAAEWQATVDGLRALQRAQEVPDRLVSGLPATLDGSEFDVEEYFAVFEHIDAEPGFVLDYVYRSAPDRGYPVLYVHRADEPGYATWDELEAATGIEATDDGEYLSYLDQIYVVDGTPKGFFELAVLRVMGAQFYLHWHAQADDELVVVTGERLEEVLAPVAAQMGADALEAARAADLTPEITFEGDLATVGITTFTRWGGLQRRTLSMERMFPQRILEEQVEIVAPCDCGITF
jgi:hypothetical protein